LRYIHLNGGTKKCKIRECFLEFVGDNKKAAESAAELMDDTLKTHSALFVDCRGQGSCNRNVTRGSYNVVQSHDRLEVT